MRIQEVRHPGELWLMYWLGNLLSIDSDYIRSVGIAWLFKENGKWCFVPRFTGEQALFFNAVFFLRFSLPFGIFWSIRWAELGPVILGKNRVYWQSGGGFKLNGRFALLFRVQGDASSAAGVTGQNFGQAQGWNYGPH